MPSMFPALISEESCIYHLLDSLGVKVNPGTRRMSVQWSQRDIVSLLPVGSVLGNFAWQSSVIFSSRFSSHSLKMCFILYVTTSVLDLADRFSRERRCCVESQGSAFFSLLSVGETLNLGNNFCPLNLASIPSPTYPCLADRKSFWVSK